MKGDTGILDYGSYDGLASLFKIKKVKGSVQLELHGCVCVFK